jgi:itaconate CoA-transferase
MYAYSAVLAALIQRGRTGEGSHLDVSMLEALTEWMGNPLYYSFQGQPRAPRAGASHPSIYPYGPFGTGDGKTVLFGLQNEREWQVFCEQVLQSPQVATDKRFESNIQRSSNRDSLRVLIEEVFGDLTAMEVIRRLERANIGNGRVNEIADVWAHAQLQARDRWTEVMSPVGALPALKPPAISDSYECRMGPIPSLGEHTASILQNLGYSSDEIAELRTNNII